MEQFIVVHAVRLLEARGGYYNIMLGIGNYDKVNRREVVTRVGQRMYMGKKYAIEKATGYLVCTSGDRKRLHDVMWSYENKMEIPEGYVVHHIDWDKTHNEISNLTCISVFGHNLIHNPPKDDSMYRVKIVPGGISEVIVIDKK